MVAVKCAEFPDGEICLHTKDGIIIFDTTPELVRYLDMKARQVISLRDWLTMVVVLVTLGLFVAVVFYFKNQSYQLNSNRYGWNPGQLTQAFI